MRFNFRVFDLGLRVAFRAKSKKTASYSRASSRDGEVRELAGRLCGSEPKRDWSCPGVLESRA